MASVFDFTDPYVRIFTPVPNVAPSVCRVCRSAAGKSDENSWWAQCASCHRTMQQVSRPIDRIVPISLYELDGQLHKVLREYKDPGVRKFRLIVAATLARFIAQHGKCMVDAAGFGWDLVTTVPSTRGREGAHPLVHAVQMVSALREIYETILEPGSTAIDHRHADDDGYRVTGDVSDRRILLVDDTFTTGARLQSAASRLQLDGAHVVAAVVVGRVVRPDWDDHRPLWERCRGQDFSFDVCCVGEH